MIFFDLLTAVVAPVSQLPPIGADFNGADVCGVLQSAYIVAINKPEPVYPTALVGPWHAPALLKDYVQEYRKRLPLTSSEIADLQSEQPNYAWKHFVPSCHWQGRAYNGADHDAGWTTSFSYPVFSSNRSFAILNVSFYKGAFGHGFTCVTRKSATVWTAKM